MTPFQSGPLWPRTHSEGGVSTHRVSCWFREGQVDEAREGEVGGNGEDEAKNVEARYNEEEHEKDE